LAENLLRNAKSSVSLSQSPSPLPTSTQDRDPQSGSGVPPLIPHKPSPTRPGRRPLDCGSLLPLSRSQPAGPAPFKLSQPAPGPPTSRSALSDPSPSNFSLLTSHFSPPVCRLFLTWSGRTRLPRATLRVAPTPKAIPSIPSMIPKRSVQLCTLRSDPSDDRHPRTPRRKRPVSLSTRFTLRPSHHPSAGIAKRRGSRTDLSNYGPRHLEAACPTMAPTEAASSPRRPWTHTRLPMRCRSHLIPIPWRFQLPPKPGC